MMGWVLISLQMLAFAPLASGAGDFDSQDVSPLVYKALPEDEPLKSNLRQPLNKPNSASWVASNTDTDRQLQDGTTPPAFSSEFTIPFRLIWNMKFSDDTVIREPTEDEINGLLFATLRWLLASANEVYAEESNFLAVKSMDMTRFGASFNATDEYPSTVGMECQAIFFADNEFDIPSIFQFLVTFSAEYNRTVFLQDYLTAPQTVTTGQGETVADPGIFTEVTEVRYNIIPSALSGIAASEGPLDIRTVRTTLEFQLGIGYGINDREATLEEYEGFVAATSEWLTEVLMDAYPGTDPARPAFHMLSTSREAAEYDPAASNSHTIQVQIDVSFRIPPTSVTPTTLDVLDALRAADLENYRLNYLHSSAPPLGIFTGVVTLSWEPRFQDSNTYIVPP